MAAPPASRGMGWLEALDAWGYTASEPPEDDVPLDGGRVLHRRISPPAETRRRATTDDGDLDPAVERFETAIDEANRAARPPFRAASGDHEPIAEPVAPRPPDAGSTDASRAVGVVLHRLLDAWDEEDRERLPELLEKTCDAVGRQEGVDTARLRDETSVVLDAFVSSPLADRFVRVEKLGRELPMLLRDEDGVVIRGRIDLVYRDESGKTVVADYKTDRESDTDLLLSRHGEQLRTYAIAARDALDLAEMPRAELWLLRHGTTVTLR
jgi:ATP-dependent exoDNAse (exonuclease V) beta subunit